MQCQYQTKKQDSSKTEGIVKVGNRRRRTKTVKIRTALPRPCPAEQTDNGQKLDSGQNRDMKKSGQTGTGHNLF